MKNSSGCIISNTASLIYYMELTTSLGAQHPQTLLLSVLQNPPYQFCSLPSLQLVTKLKIKHN